MGLKIPQRAPVKCHWHGTCDAQVGRCYAHGTMSGIRGSSRSSRRSRHRLQSVRAESQLQDLIVGGALLTAVTAALVNGLKGEPKVCDLCQGVGGTKCFACDGSGMQKATPEKKLAPGGLKRNFLGRVPDPQACRVCGGSGTNLCSKCKGSGYLSSL